jgi:hypothetical protein
MFSCEKKMRRENDVRESLRREKYSRFDMLFGTRERDVFNL